LETKRLAALAMLEALNSDAGFDIEIYKKYKSRKRNREVRQCAGAVYGINVLLGNL
jgi:homoserine kinase